jgi:hypothetical protein
MGSESWYMGSERWYMRSERLSLKFAGIKTEAVPSAALWNGGTFPEPFRESRPGGGAPEASDPERGAGGDRQASPAPRLNDQSVTSISTELEGDFFPCHSSYFRPFCRYYPTYSQSRSSF